MNRWSSLPIGADKNQQFLDLAETVLKELVVNSTNVSISKDILELRFKVEGCFVSLYHGTQQRACLGVIESSDEIAKLIIKSCFYSSKYDDRYNPVNIQDFQELTLSIWFIKDFKEFSSPSSIDIGRHGIYLVNGKNTALYLPYAPLHHNWTEIQFLEETCKKADLDIEKWKDNDTKIKIFETYKLTKEI